MPPPPRLRTHEIRPPSARAETWAVARAVFHIVYWSALLISGQAAASGNGTASAPPTLAPLERRFADLEAADQRLFRELREGMAEAEAARSLGGAWPSAAALGTRGVPPFAEDPIDRARYRWTSLSAKTVTNYLGTPDPASGRPTFLVIVTEPDPGTAIDPAATVDEIHHRLGDGTMIHVTVWTGPDLGPLPAPVSVPDLERGFRQIVVRDP